MKSNSRCPVMLFYRKRRINSVCRFAERIEAQHIERQFYLSLSKSLGEFAGTGAP